MAFSLLSNTSQFGPPPQDDGQDDEMVEEEERQRQEQEREGREREEREREEREREEREREERERVEREREEQEQQERDRQERERQQREQEELERERKQQERQRQEFERREREREQREARERGRQSRELEAAGGTPLSPTEVATQSLQYPSSFDSSVTPAPTDIPPGQGTPQHGFLPQTYNKDEISPIYINTKGVEYTYEDLDDELRGIFNHQFNVERNELLRLQNRAVDSITEYEYRQLKKKAWENTTWGMQNVKEKRTVYTPFMQERERRLKAIAASQG